MPRDLPDKILWLLLIITTAALVAILASHASMTGDTRRDRGIDKALERETLSQARMALLQKLYGPVEQLRSEGQLQAALLKLEEIHRTHSGEAHGNILQGEILLQMGAFEEAVANFARGVELNGEYVDAKSPLSRRAQIEKTVAKGLVDVKSQNQNQAGKTLKNLYYLQSRLAGGCE